jgi:uncharacterized membrane protein (Fun14 family)
VTFHDFREYLADFAWFWPGIGISIVLGIVLSARVGPALRVSRAVATVLLLAVGLIASATLTPSREALRFGAIGRGTCDLGRIGFAPISDLLEFGDPLFNVLLFVPLGIAIGFLPSSTPKAVLVASALAFPFAIETIQLLATGLDRACQSADVSDNLTGLVIGLAVGIAARRLRGSAMKGNGNGGPSEPQDDVA